MKPFPPLCYPVTHNTTYVGPGSTFVAIKGYKLNGTDFIEEAIARGATTIVTQEDQYPAINRLQQAYAHITFLTYPDARKALALLSSAASNHAWQKLTIIGITGTKGKSTTTHLIYHLLKTAGYKVALLGGITHKINDYEYSTQLTTSESDYLHLFFATCVAQEVTHVVMEISSHAVSLHRIYGITFDVVGFTNLGQDHLDFYQTMDNYYRAKAHLFAMVKPKGLVCVNAQQLWGQQALKDAYEQAAHATIQSFSYNDDTDATASHHVTLLENNLRGVLLTVHSGKTTSMLRSSTLLGRFNSENIVMASIIAQHLGINLATIQQALDSFKGTPGRMEIHTLDHGARAIVDFAHNPSSMHAVLETLRPLTTHLIVVFGCGGNRDSSKRPLMGALAAQYADMIILTNDNPRFEDPLTIIEQIKQGIPGSFNTQHVICISDRQQAIEYAIEHSTSESLIAILGKGHETHILIKDQQIPFNDLQFIRQF